MIFFLNISAGGSGSSLQWCDLLCGGLLHLHPSADRALECFYLLGDDTKCANSHRDTFSVFFGMAVFWLCFVLTKIHLKNLIGDVRMLGDGILKKDFFFLMD